MLERSTLALYRDCIRLANHIGGKSAKGQQLRAIAREAFKKHMHETDTRRIEVLRADATRALSNYLLMKTLHKKQQTSFEGKE